MKNRKSLYVVAIIAVALILGFFDLPATKQTSIWASAPDFIKKSEINLGLDLQGGSQLDYKIDLRKVPPADQKSIIDGILNVINKRVNSLGVSEPNIYTSDVGDEKHLIVELAGIKDLEQAKQIVGKTIQLEFKEQKTGPQDPNEVDNIKKEATDLLAKSKAGNNLKVLGQEEQLAKPDKVLFTEITDFTFKDKVPANLADTLFKLDARKTADNIVVENGTTLDQNGQTKTGIQGFHVLKVTEKNTIEREVKTPKSVQTRHILIAYKGADRADASITRTEAEAKTRAEEVETKLKAGVKFEDLAKEYSDDKSNKDQGGALKDPVVTDGTTYVKEFTDAALGLTANQVSAPVKTSFGFHIIKADSVTEAKDEKKSEPQIKYMDVFYSALPDQWKETGLNGQHFVHADVAFNNAYQPYVDIQFNDEGSKLFEDITGRNVNKPVAIFVGGQLISAPNVNEKITGGKAQISGRFTISQANDLARNLNTGAIPAPIILAGQYTIGATLGQDALAKSLTAGLIGFILVALFMILYYRLPGLLAVIALTVYSTILIFLIKVALPLGVSLAIAIAVFIFLIAKILKSRDSGPEKGISLILACFILFFLSFVLSTPIVLTLAGIAGVVLSIGMAVDANILIFERIKEELRDGRALGAAIEVGFDRAWNSIRDSNFSSLITCGILFYFGSSIIQGFAFNLAAGILVSMFTAITVSKTLIAALVNTKLSQNLWLFGAPKRKERKLLPIIQNRKIVYWISGILLVVTMIGIPIFGLKLGLDFTGGTLMEFQFKQPVEIAKLKDALAKSEEIVNKTIGTTSSSAPLGTNAALISTPAAGTTAATLSSSQALISGTQQTPTAAVASPAADSSSSLSSEEVKLDFSKAQIVPTENGYIIKSQHISTDTHDKLIIELKKIFSDLEESRFSTVGPTVGASMQYRAIIAVIVASIMIIAYIAFAFRRVPRYIGKWRFGVTAVLALLHDLGIMLGVYVYFGVIFGVEIDSLFITALLTILGFSVHDTIVVFDRIREKLKYQGKDQSFEDLANQAVNETIARSINTSFSVALTMLALSIFGPPTIRFFVLSLLVGVISGTYSSIFVATPLLVDWHKYNRDKAAKTK